MNYELKFTGKNCPKCGRPLQVGIMDFGGDKPREFKILCQCELEKREKERQELKEQKRRLYLDNLRHDSGLPLKWSNITLESFKARTGAERATQACINYAENFPSLQSRGIGMYLFGTSGAGKSMLAAYIANKLLDMGVMVKWWNVTNLYMALQKSFHGDYTGPDILGDCILAGLLILDDLGAEKPSEWTMTTMYDIINSRIENVLPTIITSNLTFEDLQKVADSRVISRLSDQSIFPRIPNTASDYRRERHEHR